MKKWNILGKIEGEKKRQDKIISILLKNREINKKQTEEFFKPRYPHDYTLKELGISQAEVKKAILRIKSAIKTKEKIIVYSDYDADGICGATILWETLNNLGANVLPYVPHREKEGYGLSETGIDNIISDPFYTKDKVPTLIITVDHGIVANQEIEYAKKKNIDVIVIDHHEAGKKLPNSYATVHTTSLCGAGVAWFFSRKLDNKKGVQLDLAAIATVSDLVPLIKANRSIVKYGLVSLNKTERKGLLAIIEEARLIKGKIGTYEIGFIIGPRLNAMGRLVHGLDSLRLLCTTDATKARELAQILGVTNRERQQLTIDTTIHAKSLYKETVLLSDKNKKRIIFLAHESYNQGVIGLVAGRVVDEYYLPTIVISKGEEYSKASCRSINGFNIIEAIRKTSDILISCGGHPMAAGFTVKTKNLDILKKRLEEIVQKEINEEILKRKLTIDCELELSDINLDLYNKLSDFSPFGIKNSEPIFVTKKVKIINFQTLGFEGKHLKLWISDDNNVSFSTIFFGMGKLAKEISNNCFVDVVYNLIINDWGGYKKLELKIRDININ